MGVTVHRTRASCIFFLYFIFFYMLFPFPTHESKAFICAFSLEHCWTLIRHLCPFWDRLFLRPSHLKPRTAFLFMAVRHLMSNCCALVCHLLLNNPPGLMLCNPVTFSNNSLMLPVGAKINRSGSRWLCVCSCLHKLVLFLIVLSMFHVWEICMHDLQCSCSQRGTRSNVLLLVALKMAILLDLLINCLPAVTTAL